MIGAAAILTWLADSIEPPPRLTLSQWAERYAVLSAENSAVPGPWRAYPYQVGMMEAFSDPTVETIVVMKSARVGYTRLLDHAIGYAIHQDPAPLLVVQPTIEDAEDFSRDELEPMVRDTPVLHGLVADAKSRTADNTVKRKNFPGGSLRLIGANAPRGFRRITVKRVFFDEVDGYPTKGAGVEGDQIALGIKRTDTFADRKIALGSTPTTKGVSRIEAAYETTDKRKYFVPCPECHEMQELVWENLRWDEGKPETVRYLCAHCGSLIPEREKWGMVKRGEWRATAPFAGKAGFHIWAAYSFSPGAAWSKIAAEWDEAKKVANTAKVFWNQVLGRSWEQTGERPEEGSLMARAERLWETEPEGVLLRTIGVDVQGDRLEVETVGWGIDLENWSLDYRVIRGDPAQAEVWTELEDHLQLMGAFAVCIDSGGHHTEQVYRFSRPQKRIYAIKGIAGEGRLIWPRQASRGKGGAKVFMVGVDSAKDQVYAQLRIGLPGAGFCHFPTDRDERYFSGLTAETVVTKYTRGFPVREYRKRPGLRNEPLDCRVYAYAALCSLGRINWQALASRRERARAAAQAAQEPAPQGIQQPVKLQPKMPRMPGRNWVKSW